ncbi:Radial spokehead-like protein, putative [Angomonas deanei]|uniref:Radial spokehead-like protein, putative n=1 Tax=Angomonas deanei TaxID=59799 RepID=A0A7G2CJG7_9TRYP|nr:Radial spokehead-like protein, putative [Angomonas deanei]
MPQISDERIEELFQSAKAYLMSATRDGVSVYDQLAKLMENILDGNMDQLLDHPEALTEYLSALEQHSFAQGDSTSVANEVSSVPPQELRRLAENQTLFERPPPEVRTVIEQPDPYTTVTTTTSKPMEAPKFTTTTAQNEFWTAAGCGLAESEAFLLDRSITRLVMEKNLSEIRFVGKIFGTSGNYYVISSRRYVKDGEKVYKEVNTMPKAPRKKGTVPVQPEPGYVGCNRLSFWVTSHPSSQWVLLPDVTPQQICAARHIRRLFSGDLEAEVVSSPPFPWSEGVYLRAQLSRIVSCTYVAPQGALEEAEEPEEEEDDDEEEEGAPRKPKEAKYNPLTVRSGEFGEEPVDVATLANLHQWVHAERFIFKNGRQTKVPEKVEEEEEEHEEEEEPEQRDDEEEEEEEPEEEEEEEEKELFTPLHADYLHAVMDIPQPPPPQDDEEEEEEEDPEVAAPPAPTEPPVEENNPAKPITDDEIRDDDYTKIKVSPWTTRLVNKSSKDHRVAVVSSLRWPGAVAYVGDRGKQWGCVYFGYGIQKTDSAFTPAPAPEILSECKDITEYMDPTAAVEKLVRRGEEIPEPDSEEDVEEQEDEA